MYQFLRSVLGSNSQVKQSWRKYLPTRLISPRRAVRRRTRGLGFEWLEDRQVLNTGPIVTFHTSLGDFKVQLFSDVAPNTVANFLQYVNSGRYNNTIIHRTFDADNPPNGNDIVQGGAFTTSGTPIQSFGTINGERNLSDTRGTIAMALSAFTSGPNAGQTNPNSATSSFFINTSNNNSAHAAQGFDLDAQGFTVFGQVLGTGMTIVDAMAAATTSSNGGQPFVNGNPIVINSVVEDGTISGTVYGDLNSDNTKNGNDVSLGGVTVFVDANNNGVFDGGELSATTNANGSYTIVGVDPGTVTVREVNPTGWAPLASNALSVTVTAGQDVTGKDFPLFLDGPSVALTTDTDSGASNHDGVTNFDNSTVAKALKFLVSGVADGATVTLFDGQTQIGQGVGSGGTTTITLAGNSAFAQGGHVITATQTLSNATSVAGPNFNLTIDSVRPQFTTPPPALPTSVQAGTNVQYDVNTNEEGNTGLTYSLVSTVPGMAINASTGQISWQTDASQTGNYNVDVKAVDLAGNVAIDPNNNNTADLKFPLAVTNQPPTIATIATQNVNQRGTLTVQVSATSPAANHDVLTYSLVSPPSGATINAQSGLLTWTLPNSIPPGVTPITVRVTNASNQSSTQTFNVNVAAVNHTPTITPIGNKTVAVGNTLTVNVAANDDDVPAQTLTYSLDAGFPTGASINATTGVLTFSPTQAQNGQTFPITVRVTDNGSPTMSATATFNVAVNNTPVFTPIGQKTVNIGSNLTFTPTVQHVNPVTYTLGAGSPAGATINATTGVFNWTPTAANGPGTFNITLQATDNVSNLTGTTVVQVLVVQPNRAPVISTIGNQTVPSGGTLSVQIHATDPDSGQTLAYSFVGTHTGATINASTGLITFNATTTSTPITQTLTIQVKDNGSPVLSSTQQFNITTNPTSASNSTARGYTGMGVDPLDSTGTGKALLVNGTDQADVIQLLPSNLGDSVIVILNNVNKGAWSLAGMSRIVVMGFGGDDSIMVSKFKVGSIVDGGAGNDTIVGGIGNDVLLGGTGDDSIYAHGGAKIMVGGAGSDDLHSGNGRNILIGGTTSFDTNDLALGAILDEWSSGDGNSTAIARLQGTLSGGQNGATVLTGVTVHDDNDSDVLDGNANAALDWFFANLASAASSDQLLGSSGNRVLTQI